MEFEVELNQDLVLAFARAVGDFSSIHTDPQFARKTQFRGPIVHGMLPVVLLLGRACYEDQPRTTARLTQICCRFLGALKIGDRVCLEAVPQSVGLHEESWSFAVKRPGSAATITTGKAVFIRSPHAERAAASDGGCLLADQVEEMDHALRDLKLGLAQRLMLRADPGALRHVLRLLDAQVGPPQKPWSFDDRSMSVVAALSTLVGMRLPGRYATFLEFDAMFPEPCREDEIVLEGSVAEIMPSRTRMRLGVSWSHAGHLIGTGHVVTMVSAVPEAPISCAEIKSEHLRLGIDGRVALVTGASRGIGEATAKALAMSGARVAVHFFRGADDARSIVEEIKSHGGTAIAVQADLAAANAAAALFGEVEAALGPVDILVNNAVGDFNPKPIDKLAAGDFLAELQISLIGMHLCCLRALPHMRRQRWGKIINLGTVATELPVASQAKYITAKSAVVGYTRSLATETATDNIQVNLVVPSMTQTSLIAALPPALIERLAEDSPAGSLLGTIDVAKTILFLASDWSSPISGQQVVLNCGAPPFL
jgi:3-oxoacyl-[acyl-carrier protein] reductase